jgi:hypothetical protein
VLGFGQVRRIDAQHVSAERGEEAGGDRAGDDAREVEHADARGGTRGRGCLPDLAPRPAGGDGVALDERLGAHRGALRVSGPGRRRAHGGRRATGSDDRRLELLGVAAFDRVERVLFADAERREQRPAMVVVVGVQAYPAVAGLGEARERRERQSERAAGAAHVAFGREGARYVFGFDREDGAPLATRLGELGGREQSAAHRADGQAVDVERRGQVAALAANLDVARAVRVAPEGRPQPRAQRST